MGTAKEVLDSLRGLDGPTVLALVEKFPDGRDGVRAVLRGEKEIVLKDAVCVLVDKNGRCIPAHLGVTSAVCDENRDFRVKQPYMNYAEISGRFIEFFPAGTKFVEVNELRDRAEAAKERFLKDALVANLFKRAHLLLPLPQHQVSDYGISLQEFFLPAAKAAYKQKFPERQFKNYRDGDLVGNFTVVPDVGHEKLLATMAESPGVCWYFPHPLQGFSVQAQREAMAALLEQGLLLAGVIEPALGIVGFPETMAGSFNTPGYDCPAVNWQSAGNSFFFEANDDELYCNDTGNLGRAHDIYSGGLVLLG